MHNAQCTMQNKPNSEPEPEPGAQSPAPRAQPAPSAQNREPENRELILQHRDVGQIAVLLAIVEAVADDEMVLDRESDILHAHVDLAA